MSRFLRPLGVTLAVGLPFLNALSDSSHRRGIARQGHSSRAHAPSATSTVAAAAAAGVEEEQPVEFNAEHYPKGLNAGFLTRSKEQVVEFYGPKFENGEARDIAANQQKILGQMGSLESKVVLDVGSGTGFFLKALSDRVGPRGLVVATDLAEGMCDRLRERIAEEAIRNAIVFQSTEKQLAVPESVEADVVFICDVYHHITFPRTFMSDVRKHTRRGGKLILIDFYRDPSKMLPGHDGDWVVNHVRADKDVFQREIESFGFKAVAEPSPADTGLTENYMIIFERTD